ncbi:hypothetical protein RFI_29533 [Reticulomyxa filosa]|uniref:Uncharacterized protein n=1 Tax=Reticulomyxa filosa TaxID=46433 RepID=X6M2P1_RETFI|nr:hypothetical protein RFI_29533 [Reticulomyxa filosa]|eukprot:ETO07856.1 hypothetical protein RFI_29533 [Reticulomyxa filosa]
MNRIWEGLFYAYWMSDKQLVQQELELVITTMVHHCSDWYTLSHEWTRIDFLRMDKFMSLVRHLMHQCLDFLALNSWDTSLCQSFSNLFLNNNPNNADNQPQGNRVLFCDSNNRGSAYHLCDIFMDELIKVCSVSPVHYLLKCAKNQHLQAEKKKTKKLLQKQINNNNKNIGVMNSGWNQ